MSRPYTQVRRRQHRPPVLSIARLYSTLRNVDLLNVHPNNRFRTTVQIVVSSRHAVIPPEFLNRVFPVIVNNNSSGRFARNNYENRVFKRHNDVILLTIERGCITVRIRLFFDVTIA